MTVQHIVLFKFPEDHDPDLPQQIRQKVGAWPGTIPGFGALRFGEDLTGERTRGHQFLLYSEFADLATLKAYQTHPLHQAFLQWVNERGCLALAFDYLLDETTVLIPTP